MFESTMQFIKCPTRQGKCEGALELNASSPKSSSSAHRAPAPRSETSSSTDIQFGQVICKKCRKSFPILAGILILVPDVQGYLVEHVKGVSKWLKDAQIPAPYRAEYLEAKSEIEVEHIEEDLESERVNALYLMNHYLQARGSFPWWAPKDAAGSPLIESLIKQYWDSGPLSKIADYFKNRKNKSPVSFVELGCGVGGLLGKVRSEVKTFLGVDSSFASIAFARQIHFGSKAVGSTVRIPEDLLNGPVSREIKLPGARETQGSPSADFIVADCEHPPLKPGLWDVTAALNMIDMLESPAQLPLLQNKLLNKRGMAIQSCPYIWHPHIAQAIRKVVPKSLTTSAQAIEWFYQQAGFQIEQATLHLPWLFFKHIRQLEVYSVHLFFANKKN
jgi:uncharacterized protein YbaR (Trm112 family)